MIYMYSIVPYTFVMFSSLTVFVVAWFDDNIFSWCKNSVGNLFGVSIDDESTIKKFKMKFDAQLMFKLKKIFIANIKKYTIYILVHAWHEHYFIINAYVHKH